MFLDEVSVIKTAPCIAEEKMFRAFAITTANLDSILPYLNATLVKPNYNPQSNSLTFKKGLVTFVLHMSNIEIRRYANTTELHELLDWVQELINDTYENRHNIKPEYEPRKVIPPLKIYKLLPKKNCKECGEPACMAFAVKLGNLEVDVDDCRQLQKNEFADLKSNLIAELDLD